MILATLGVVTIALQGTSKMEDLIYAAYRKKAELLMATGEAGKSILDEIQKSQAVSREIEKLFEEVERRKAKKK